MNADPKVMEFFLKRLTREESDAMVDRSEACFEENGFGLWALEIRGVVPFAGYVGFWPVLPEIPCAPAVEIGWRMSADAWGRGYATEAGRLALRFGFEKAGLDSIVSFAAVINTRSIAVMKRLGMRYEGTFEHPRVPEGNPLRPHVLYRIAADEWRLDR